MITFKVTLRDIPTLVTAFLLVLFNEGENETKQHSVPECRKAGIAQYLPHQSIDAGHGGLFIFAGKGNHRELIFSDAFYFDLAQKSWRELKQSCCHTLFCNEQNPPPRPSPAVCKVPDGRWKSFVAFVPSLNRAIIFGGSTRPHEYFNDVYSVRLNDEKDGAQWQPGVVMGSPDESPNARRAFGGALVVHSNGSTSLAISMGRDGSGHLLHDLWMGDITWPGIKWTKVWQGSSESQTNPAVNQTPKKVCEPPARRGHAMVYIPDVEDPLLVILGGRTTNQAGYFVDVWAFHLDTKTWEDFTPASERQTPNQVPIGRDHFQAVYYEKGIYIFGGRGGSSYKESVPLGDLWRFSVEDRTWQEIKAVSKQKPLPRFLHSVTSEGRDDGKFLVFGGEGFGPDDDDSGSSDDILLSAIYDKQDDDYDDGDGVEGHAGSFNGCYMNVYFAVMYGNMTFGASVGRSLARFGGAVKDAGK